MDLVTPNTVNSWFMCLMFKREIGELFEISKYNIRFSYSNQGGCVIEFVIDGITFQIAIWIATATEGPGIYYRNETRHNLENYGSGKAEFISFSNPNCTKIIVQYIKDELNIGGRGETQNL